jgi:peptidoglycan/LPS O-acetylase OafA/YrhL
MNRNNASSTPRHIAELDGLRGIAIMLVVIGHGVRGFSQLAVSGVALFFVLSGFLITRILIGSVDKPFYFRNFYIRRSLRIWPLYFVVLAVAYGTPLFAFSQSHFPPYRFFLYIQNFWPLDGAPPILGTTWSLAIEEQFYVAWPLVVWQCRTPQKIGWAAITLVAATPLIRVFYHLHGIDPYALTFGRLDGFAMGALLSALTIGTPSALNQRWKVPKEVIWTAAFSLVLLPLLHFTLLRKAFKDTSLSLMFCSCIGTAFYYQGSRLTALLRNTILRYFGRISYCAYLIHLALIYKLGSTLLPIALTVAIATLSWYLLELPILKIKDRLSRVDPVETERSLLELHQPGVSIPQS